LNVLLRHLGIAASRFLDALLGTPVPEHLFRDLSPPNAGILP